MSKCPPCHLAHWAASIKCRMEMKNELFSHHSKLSLSFPPHTLLRLHSHLAPLTFSLDLCFQDGSLLAYQLSGNKFIITDPFHCCFLLPCKKNWLEQGLCAPPLPPDLILCWALERYKSNCGFVSVRDWGRDHLKWYLWIYVQRREHSNILNLHYFYSILLLSLFLFYFIHIYPMDWWRKFFFSFINLHWGSQCGGAWWLPLTGLSWLPSWLAFHRAPSPHLSIHDGFNYNLKGQVKDWLDNSCVSLDFYFIYPALTVTCATTQPGVE